MFYRFSSFSKKFRRAKSLLDEKDIILAFQPETTIIMNSKAPGLEEYLQAAKKHHIENNIQVLDVTDDNKGALRDGWVNIPTLLHNISSLSRGEQHRMCEQIIIGVKNHWDKTILMNENKNVLKLIRLFDILKLNHQLRFTRNERDSKFARAQMFSGLSQMFVPQHTQTQFREIGENLMAASSHINDVSATYNAFVTRLYEYFNKIISYSSMALCAAKTIALGYLLSTIKFTRVQLTALLTLALPMEVASSLNIMGEGLIRAVKMVSDWYNTPVAQMDYDTSIMGSFFNMIKSIFVYTVCPMDKERLDKMTIDTKKMHVISDFLRSCSNIWSFIVTFTTWCFEQIQDFVITQIGYIPSFFKNENDNEISKFIVDYDSIFERHIDASKTSTESAKIIVDLLNRARKLELDIYNESISIVGAFEKMRILPLLRCAVIHLQKIVGDIPPHVRNGFAGFRKKPYWIYIHGATNIGKSSILQPILANCLAAKLKLVESFDDPHNYSYYRVCGAKFFSAYHWQPIMQYNDLFQNKGDEEAMNEAIMELTNVVDEAPFQLNMNDNEDKGKYYCTSQIVISNSQYDIIGQPFIANRCWSNGIHLYRRRNLVIEPVLNDRYESHGSISPIYNDLQYTPSRYADFIPNDLYTIKFTDPITGQLINELILDDAIEFILKDAHAHVTRQDNLHEKLMLSMGRTFNMIKADNAQAVKAQMGADNIYAKILNLGPRIGCVKLINSAIELIKERDTSSYDSINYIDTVIYDLYSNLKKQQFSNDQQDRVSWQNLINFLEKINTKPTNINTVGDMYNLAQQLSASCDIQATHQSSDILRSYHMVKYVQPNMRGWLTSVIDGEIIKNNIQGLYKKTISYVSYIQNVFSKQQNNILDIDDWHDANDYVDCPNHCLEQWKLTLSAHPLVYNDLEMRKHIIGMLEERHKNLCGTVFDNRDDIIYTLLTEAMYTLVDSKKRSFDYKFKHSMYKVSDFLKQRYQEFISVVQTTKAKNALLVAIPATIGLFGIVGLALAVFKNTSYVKEQEKTTEIVAQTDEGNIRTRKIRIKRTKVTEQATAQYDITNRVVEEVTKQNIVTFKIFSIDDTTLVDEDVYMHALAVCGSVFVLPRHFWTMLEKLPQDNILLQLTWANNTTINIPLGNIIVYKPEFTHLVDIVFIRIDKLCSKRDIRHFFVSCNDDIDQHEAYIFGKRALHMSPMGVHMNSVDNVEVVSLDYIIPNKDTKTYGLIQGETVKVPVAYKYYNSKTVHGDCGALLMFVNPKLNSRVIAGMHIAGVTSEGLGYSAPIFREDIDDAIKNFDVTLKKEPMGAVPVFAQMGILTPVGEQLKDIGANVIGRTGMINKKYVNLTVSRKTHISKSAIFDYLENELGPHTQKPAHLRPFTNNKGERISPLMLAYKKMGNMCPNHIPNKLYTEILEHCSNAIESWTSPFTTGNAQRTVLDMDDTINGIPGIKQLDLSTSPGFPYIVTNSNNGKRPWFIETDKDSSGLQHYMPNAELMEQINKREELAKKGIKMETYFVDTLKDETRPNVKVDEGKTRLFQVAPMDYNILFRKYFSCFLSHMSTTFIDGECAVGVNCLSNEWHFMFQQFLHAYDYDSDASNFDASTPFQVGMVHADLANMFYNDGDENALIRRVLVATALEALHIVGDAVIESYQGNKSGVVGTTHINNTTNMFINRFAYRLTETLDFYDKNVKNKFYGDDVRGNTSLNWFNAQYLKEKLAILGFVITPASKDETDTTISFLKRKNAKNEHVALNVGCLNKAVIEEIPRWCEGDVNNMRDQMQRFNSSLMESALHGSEYFSYLRSIYTKACHILKENRYNINANELLSFHNAMKTMFGDRYSYPRFKSLNN